jgi:hypothetical protein
MMMVIVCPFTVQQYGSAVTCHKDACRMWHNNDCAIKNGFVAFVELMNVLSDKAKLQ